MDRALRTPGLPSHTDTPAVVLHQVAEADASFPGNDFHEISFDFVGIGVSRKTEALRETDDADTDALLACRRLLCDGFSSPLYAGRADDLRREAGRLRFRVLSGHVRG